MLLRRAPELRGRLLGQPVLKRRLAFQRRRPARLLDQILQHGAVVLVR
ncbi:hypothetical protein [Frankia casuarinae]|nr:hypothetical protein [Frankia casuarinae]